MGQSPAVLTFSFSLVVGDVGTIWGEATEGSEAFFGGKRAKRATTTPKKRVPSANTVVKHPIKLVVMRFVAR